MGNIKYSLFLVFYAFLSLTPLLAQVSIGENTPPEKASLLDVKTQEADVNNVTTTVGGLLLPRVKLVDKTTLEPFVSNDADFQNNVDKVKSKHKGLIVFNLTSSMNNSVASKQFLPGVYLWDGSQWQLTGDSKRQIRWFYPPAFNLPLPAVDGPSAPLRKFDLYGEYERQFKKNNVNNPQFVDTQNVISSNIASPIDGKLYQRTELDYVITYYDFNVIYDVSIDSQGILSYRVRDNDPGSGSFANLIFIVKE